MGSSDINKRGDKWRANKLFTLEAVCCICATQEKGWALSPHTELMLGNYTQMGCFQCKRRMPEIVAAAAAETEWCYGDISPEMQRVAVEIGRSVVMNGGDEGGEEIDERQRGVVQRRLARKRLSRGLDSCKGSLPKGGEQ